LLLLLSQADLQQQLEALQEQSSSNIQQLSSQVRQVTASVLTCCNCTEAEVLANRALGAAVPPHCETQPVCWLTYANCTEHPTAPFLSMQLAAVTSDQSIEEQAGSTCTSSLHAINHPEQHPDQSHPGKV
jgi:hypothetical protein